MCYSDTPPVFVLNSRSREALVRRFLRWLVGVPGPVDVDVIRALEDVRDDVAHLGRRFTKLQTQFTRWARESGSDEDEDDSDELLDMIEERRKHG